MRLGEHTRCAVANSCRVRRHSIDRMVNVPRISLGIQTRSAMERSYHFSRGGVVSRENLEWDSHMRSLYPSAVSVSTC